MAPKAPLRILDVQDGLSDPTTRRIGFKPPTLTACMEWAKQATITNQHIAILLDFDEHEVSEFQRIIYSYLRMPCTFILESDLPGRKNEILATAGERPLAWMLPATDLTTRHYRHFVEMFVKSHNAKYKTLFTQPNGTDGYAKYIRETNGRFDIVPWTFRYLVLTRSITTQAAEMQTDVRLREEDTEETVMHLGKRKNDEELRSPKKRQRSEPKTRMENCSITIKDEEGKTLCRVARAEICSSGYKKGGKFPMDNVTVNNLWANLEGEQGYSREGHGIQWMHGTRLVHVNMDDRLQGFLLEYHNADSINPCMVLIHRRRELSKITLAKNIEFNRYDK
ncbi:hypothetical protein KCU93_g1675, partial [Aureobasidium melanogenum]